MPLIRWLYPRSKAECPHGAPLLGLPMKTKHRRPIAHLLRSVVMVVMSVATTQASAEPPLSLKGFEIGAVAPACPTRWLSNNRLSAMSSCDMQGMTLAGKALKNLQVNKHDGRVSSVLATLGSNDDVPIVVTALQRKYGAVDTNQYEVKWTRGSTRLLVHGSGSESVVSLADIEVARRIIQEKRVQRAQEEVKSADNDL
jgi:hypothetical protein